MLSISSRNFLFGQHAFDIRDTDTSWGISTVICCLRGHNAQPASSRRVVVSSVYSNQKGAGRTHRDDIAAVNRNYWTAGVGRAPPAGTRAMPCRRSWTPQYSIDVRLDQKATWLPNPPVGLLLWSICCSQRAHSRRSSIDTLAVRTGCTPHQAIGDVCLVVQVDLTARVKGAPDRFG